MLKKFSILCLCTLSIHTPLLTTKRHSKKTAPVKTAHGETAPSKKEAAPIKATPAEKLTVGEQAARKTTPRTITVTNNIKDSCLAYSYCFISYSPSSFSLTVNGTALKPNESKAVTLDGNTLKVRYDYAFLGGKRTGAKEVTFELPGDKQSASVQFSWNNDWRIIVDGAKPVTSTKIY